MKDLAMPRIPRASASPSRRQEVEPPAQDDQIEVVGSTSHMRDDSQQTEGSVPGTSATPRSRGVARGLRVESGDTSRLEVTIPTEWNAPVGPNATRFAGELGVRVRQDLPNFDYDRWSSIPASDKAPIMANVKEKFSFIGQPEVVDSVLNQKLATYSRKHKYKLHATYEKLVELNGEVYACNNPPRGILADQWVRLIDNIWTTDKFKEKSAKGKASRAKQTVNHSSGSRSLAARAHEAIQRNDGQLNFPEFYKETHYNKKKEKWATATCEELHSQMIVDAETQSSQSDAVPMTPEAMADRYLGTRPGVVKGIGMRPTASMKSTGNSAGHEAEVELLKKKLAEQDDKLALQDEKLAEQNEMLAEQKDKMAEQDKKIDTLMDFMRNMSYHGGPPPPPDGSAGCGLMA